VHNSFIYLHQTNGPYQEKQQQQKKEKEKHACMHNITYTRFVDALTVA